MVHRYSVSLPHTRREIESGQVTLLQQVIAGLMLLVMLALGGSVLFEFIFLMYIRFRLYAMGYTITIYADSIVAYILSIGWLVTAIAVGCRRCVLGGNLLNIWIIMTAWRGD